MEKVARFHKVSLGQWIGDIQKLFGDRYSEEQAEELWNRIVMPKRATAGSAGYDICTPVSISQGPGERIRIPTGIRAEMRQDYCLLIMPRSGLGSRYRFQLDNTTGVIDSDYFYSDNEGHIFVPMINDCRDGKTLELKAGSAFVQGIFCPFGITDDDDAEGIRNGGFGSTD